MSSSMEVHKVMLPPPKSTLAKSKAKLKDIFFPDDPLRRFEGQPLSCKWILGAQYLFPILQWAPNYTLKHFKSDVLSGLTIASLAIPQGISYAKLGSSRDLAVGPVSIASLIMGSMLRQEVSPGKEPLLFLQLAFTSTFFAGVFQSSLGFLRLGFIIDFLSKANLVGFMAGAAIIVSLQQLKSLLGIEHFTKQIGVVPVLSSVFHRIDENLKTPKPFWVSAGAPLFSVVIATLIVFALKAQNHGISITGRPQHGLNPPSWNMLQFHGSHLALAVKTGLVTGTISLTEGIAVGRTFASLKNYKVDGNKEMLAIGLMNVVGSCASCYVFQHSSILHPLASYTVYLNGIIITIM